MLPKARIKRVMKADEDVKNIKPEAVIMVAKATELFVELLTEQAYRHATADKRKGLAYKVSARTPPSRSAPKPAVPSASHGRHKTHPTASGPGGHGEGGGEVRLSAGHRSRAPSGRR